MAYAKNKMVAITGMGLITSLGAGLQTTWQKLIKSESGVSRITRFNTDGFTTKIAACINFLKESEHGSQQLTEKLAFLALHEAVEQARIAPPHFGGRLFFAAPPLEMPWETRFLLDEFNKAAPSYNNMLQQVKQRDLPSLNKLIDSGACAQNLAQHLGMAKHPIVLNTACASGATAITQAVNSIRSGACDRALALGADGSITVESLVRFSLLATLSTQNSPPEKAAKPFSADRDGFVMAEGAAAMVLENLDAALKRGANILAVVTGYGEKTDSYHRTRSSPDAASAYCAMKSAIEDAKLNLEDIDYINAHGTGTIENEKIEYLALKKLFGDSLGSIPVSSNKSMIGHCLTAAGIVEAVISVLTIQNSVLPPTINYHLPDPDLELDVVPNQAKKKKIRNLLSNSFGFGGQNTSILISAYEN